MAFYVDLRPCLAGFVLLSTFSCYAHTLRLSSSVRISSPLSAASRDCVTPTVGLPPRYQFGSIHPGGRYRNHGRCLSWFPRLSRHCSTIRGQAVTCPHSTTEGKALDSSDRLDESSCLESNTLPIAISEVTFGGLRSVAKLFVEEFFGFTLWYPAQYLGELHRLQSNYHSVNDECRHLMLVATSSTDGTLAGFVDIDGRAKRIGQAGPPRPYLSDLVVSPQSRRRGVGTALVRACEAACISWGYDRMYLKVRAGNAAAERLYRNLGYDVHCDEESKSGMTLCGELDAASASEDYFPKND